MRAASVLCSLVFAIELAVSCSPPDFEFVPTVTARCDDKIRNGDESDVDCGGACTPCRVGQDCGGDDDCANRSCVSGVCQAAHCVDGATSGDESDVDCGGEACTKCGVNQRCNSNSDCRSNACQGGRCVATGCDDNVMGEGETGVDCGGMTCPPCKNGQRCESGGDCESGICVNDRCESEQCGNAQLDPNEEGVDCGGVCLRQCDPVAACEDQKITGFESDVDCGGDDCPPCGLGKVCFEDDDCESKTCALLSSGADATRRVCVPNPCPEPPCDEPSDGGAGGMGGAPDAGTGGTTGTGGTGGAGGTLGSAGTAGEGGTSPSGGAGGAGGTVQGGAGGTMAGGGTAGTPMGGAPNGGTGPLGSCPGCARLSVPLADASHKANFVITLPNVMDFSNTQIRYRVYREAGSGGSVKGYIQHSGSPDYQQLFQREAQPISDIYGWVEFTWDVAAHDTTFDKTIVGRVGIQVTGAEATSWTNPTVILVDSITVIGAAAGPWTFDYNNTVDPGATTSAAPNVLWRNNGDNPVAGATVTWLGP